MFIQLRDKVRTHKRNIVLDLKPEGYQLIRIKEDVLAHLSEGAREHLITAFWEYLIYLEIAHKLLEKDQHSYRYTEDIHAAYTRLRDTYSSEGLSAKGDFSERLSTLVRLLGARCRQKYGTEKGLRLTASEVTGLVYTHDIREIRDMISDGRIPDFPVTRSHPPASWPSAANSSICRTYRKTAGEESRRRSPAANRWMRP